MSYIIDPSVLMANRVLNPGFESALANWTKSDVPFGSGGTYTVQTTGGYPGNHAGSLHCDVIKYYSSYWHAYRFYLYNTTPITVTGGYVATLSFWLFQRSDYQVEAPYDCFVEVRDGAHDGDLIASVSPPTTDVDEYKQYSTAFLVPIGCSSVVILLGTEAEQGWFAFDDIFLNQAVSIPSPCEEIYPTLPGLTYEIKRSPSRWKTLVQETVDGHEDRAALCVYGRYSWVLTYEFLRAATGFQEFQILLNFFNLLRGSANCFRLFDGDDYMVTGQAIGTGDGVETDFQMIRTLGGADDPVLDIMALPTVYLDDVVTDAYDIDCEHGLLLFDTAPGDGVVITADITYYWRCRFLNDQTELAKFMHQLWTARQVELISLKRA